MSGLPAFRRALRAYRSRPQTRHVPQKAAWRDVVCSILEENWPSVVNALPIGAVRAEHHFGPAARIDEEAESDAGGCFPKLTAAAMRVKISETGAGIGKRPFYDVTLLHHGTIPFHRSTRHAAIRE